MKNLVFIFYFFILLNVQAYSQENNEKIDIENEYLVKFLIKQDSTKIVKFRNFAIDLFLNGTKVSDSILNNKSENFVGVCLINEIDSLKNKNIEFNLYTLCYKDTRESDFHKRIYFPGREGIANFDIICYNDNHRKILGEAINSYLSDNTIPKSNLAYKFAKNYEPEESDYEKVFESNKFSKIIIGHSYSYLRMNGNYLIQIEGFPDRDLNPDSENLYVTDAFINNWYSISVFIINEDLGLSYNRKF